MHLFPIYYDLFSLMSWDTNDFFGYVRSLLRWKQSHKKLKYRRR